MGGIINPYVFGGVANRSLDFDSAGSKYLTMSSTDFGTFDRAKWAFCCQIKRKITGTQQGIFSQAITARYINLGFTSTDNILYRTFDGGSTRTHQTTAAYNSTSSWYHIMIHYDSANATSSLRKRLWVNGSEVTGFSTAIAPLAAIDSSTDYLAIGENNFNGVFLDALVYQPAFFSGTLPAIGDVYDAGGALDLSGLPGLYSLLTTNDSDSLEDDRILTPNWTNNNSVTKSTDIP